jgi:hypothetical protein
MTERCRAGAIALLVAVVAASILGGCGSSDVDTVAAQRRGLEQMIKPKLARQLSQAAGSPVRIDKVTCTHASAGKFECLAEVSASDGQGGRESTALEIAATCDSANCIWRVREP